MSTVALVILTAGVAAPRITVVEGAGQTFYVSRLGSNSDGRSWATAWTELNLIPWAAVKPGDTVLIDGGSLACPSLGPGYDCGMVYNTTLDVAASGTSAMPITVRLADEPGRNGTVIIDGGITAWARCAEYAPEPTPPSVTNGAAPRQTGINMNDSQWVVLDGGKWGGIEVRNHTRYGLGLSGSQHITARYLKLHHNTDPVDDTNGAAGVTQNYRSQHNTLSRLEIFRNGQDAIRGGGDYFTVEESYLHDHYCNHPDGIQSFVPTLNSDVPDNEGEVRGLVMRRNVFDRIGLQTIFLGENGSHQSWNVDVTITDNLFLNSMYPIKSKHGSSTNWTIAHNTFIGATNFGVQWCCASPGALAPMVIADNIFTQVAEGTTAFHLTTGNGTTTFSGNCLYRTGKRSGNFTESGTITADPLFVDAAAGLYALQAGSACAGKGSSLNSVNQLLALGSDAIPPPAATPTESPSATATLEVPSATVTETSSALATETAAISTATSTAEFDVAQTQPATSLPTFTSTPVAAETDLPPTATETPQPPTATDTDTAVPPTATDTAQLPTATNSVIPPTPTSTATETPLPPSATSTATATRTLTPPTITPTRTLAPPTATRPAVLPTATPVQILTLSPVADAYVDAEAPTTKYGTSTILRTRSSPAQRAYLRFSVSGVMGRPVTRAYLRIYVNKSATSGFRVSSVTNNTWVESTLTYQTAPAVGSQIATSGAHSGGVWVLVDVTSLIKGDGVYSLALTSTNTASVSYNSRNAATNRPQLIVHVGGAP